MAEFCPAKRGLGEGPEDGQELTDAQVAEALQAEEVCMHAPYMYMCRTISAL